MERQPPFEIIGGSEDKKKQYQWESEQEEIRARNELFMRYLVMPDQKEQIAIDLAVEYANKIAKEYGSNREVYSENNVFLLEEGGNAEIRKVLTHGQQSLSPASYYARLDAITVDRPASKALLALYVVHEALHANSYQAFRIVNKRILKFFKIGKLKRFRSGIEMEGKNEEADYFSLAGEAITATLSRRFFDEVVSSHPAYREEIKRTKEIKKWISENSTEQRFVNRIEDVLLFPENEHLYDLLVSSDVNKDEKWNCVSLYLKHQIIQESIVVSEREYERKKFNEVLSRIMFESNGKITDENELFDKFAQANFSGKYLPLAKYIEQALGKGSFRMIAIELGNIHSESLKEWYKEKLKEKKPPYLYHGTINTDIAEFEPRSALERPDEDPAVYASPDFKIAAQSMANKFVSNGGILNGKNFVCIPMTREEFVKQDHGGIIYTLPSDSFEINEGKGFGGNKEWVSKVAVKPQETMRFGSLLNTMIENGIEVYFIQPEMVPLITKAQNNPKELEALLKNLKPERE